MINQTHQVADSIAIELDAQINQLQKAFITINDTRSDIKTANQFIKYFGKELYKDKVWRGLLIFIILLIITVICLKLKNPSKKERIEYDILNGYN